VKTHKNFKGIADFVKKKEKMSKFQKVLFVNFSPFFDDFSQKNITFL